MKENDRTKKVLILGVDASTIDTIDYLKKRGIYTIITDYRNPVHAPEKRMADEYWMIDVADTDSLEEACRREGITNIFAGSSEFCIDQCKVLCRKLGMPFYASDLGWKASRDKLFYKELCMQTGLLVPERYLLDSSFSEGDLRKIKYPVIVKPNDSEGRKGVFFVRNESELRDCYLQSLAYSPKGDVLVEEYIDGDDIVIFGYIHKRKLYFINTIVNHGIQINGETRLGFVEHSDDILKSIDYHVVEAYQKIVSELECENGVCLFQGIRRNGLIYNTEFGFRLDGVRVWRTIRRTRGIDYLEWMINLALGKDNSDCFTSDFSNLHEQCISCALWGKPGKISQIVGREELYDRSDIIILIDRYRSGDIIPDVSSMLGIAYAFDMFGHSQEDLQEKYNAISSRLHVYDEEGQDLLIHPSLNCDKWK